MISVAISGEPPGTSRFRGSVETVKIGGIPITVGLVETAEPEFDPEAPGNAPMVLIKIRAFSCNYRDKALILYLSQEGSENSHYFIGSEFVGEVVAIGQDVTGFQQGDRVVANCQYPDSGVDGADPGIPTNHASQRYWTVHEAKLLKVSPEMPDEVAAAFSLGAQTAYSMVRKLSLREEEPSNVLVTAAKSNTSLFVVNALKTYHLNLYATSSSMLFEKEIKEMGVKELIQINPNLQKFSDNEWVKLVSETAGFDYVVDPFFDLHIGKVIDVMKPGAKYITCGLHGQYPYAAGKQQRHHGRDLSEIMAYAISKNLCLIGNCLGETRDLKDALEDYASGFFSVVVDSVFTGSEVGAFFGRTYNVRDRFGKVVYKYADTD